MDSFFITNISIFKVRHLQEVDILISESERKHLILTGMNGCGKTSVLDVLNLGLKDGMASNNVFKRILNNFFEEIEMYEHNSDLKSKKIKSLNTFKLDNQLLFNTSNEKAEFILFNYTTDRKLKVNKSEGVKDNISDRVEDFEKYLAKKRTEQAFLSFETGNAKEIKKISDWFEKLESSLKFIFEDKSLKLLSKRTEDKLDFYLTSDHREEYDFNKLSSGFSSILYILFDMMQKMQNESGSFDYTKEGIALIDEIEAHLHISLQKKILPFLTGFFPNVQFIVTTHSPFILQSIKNSVIFDLETKKRYEDFSNYSSESILETFYNMDKFGDEMKAEMEKYESLLQSKNGQSKEEIKRLRQKFLEIPDIEISYWIKDMDIRHKEKIKQLL